MGFNQQPAAAHRSIYKDAVFDTNEKDGIQYTNLENTQKTRAFTDLPVIPAELWKPLMLCPVVIVHAAASGKLTPLRSADRQIIKMWSNN